MSGINYFFDTNTIIEYLKGSPVIDELVAHADCIGISVISIVEFYSFKHLTDIDKTVFSIFYSRVAIVDITYSENSSLIFKSSSLRASSNLKLPDAFIAASALLNDAILVTNDKHFNNIQNLQVIHF